MLRVNLIGCLFTVVARLRFRRTWYGRNSLTSYTNQPTTGYSPDPLFCSQRGPPPSPKRCSKRVVEPYDDGWPEYEGACYRCTDALIVCLGVLLPKSRVNWLVFVGKSLENVDFKECFLGWQKNLQNLTLKGNLAFMHRTNFGWLAVSLGLP